MTSESEALKTNEFLRRRKLRLQQVREQSRDIAKKLRQRANTEKLQNIEELKSKKEKDYIKHQEKLIKRLEQLYAQGVKSVGDSHHQASAIQETVSNDKQDLSKIRGKEAAAELRKKKQEKLDQQKKILDRKLLARETANELSREKASSVANKIIAKATGSQITVEAFNSAAGLDAPENGGGDSETKVTKNDMATQWEGGELPNEWESTVPALSLPKDDRDSVKESSNIPETKSERSKRLDLFALSSEMPSSLRGGLSNVSEERSNVRPSLTMVSEYLQNRALRLRETVPSKKHATGDDLHSLKQTIQHIRSSKVEVTRNVDKSAKSSDAELFLNKKGSVTMYNHSTRNTRDIPYGEPCLVVRDSQAEDDAYANALKETSANNATEKDHLKKLQEMRNKVATTKQTVEKEYNDTMSFLKSLPKEKCSKHMKVSHMDERRQQMEKDRRQLKLQREFNKIERESRKESEMASNCKVTSVNRKQSKSPVEAEFSDEYESRDLQYSWMPVPESDGNLAIHTIPTTLKEGKSGNTVKFSKIDSYHEYRSRHKHTPPTKDTNKDKHTNNKNVETIFIQKDESETMDYSSSSSDTSSIENSNQQKKKSKKPSQIISDKENVVIYKIRNSMSKKDKERKRLKLIDDVAKVLTAMDKEKMSRINKDNNNNKGDIVNTNAPFEQISEGVYKVVNEKGDNITSLYFPEKQQTDDNTNINQKRRKRNKNLHFTEDTGNQSGSDNKTTTKTAKCVDRNKSVGNSNTRTGETAGPYPSAATSTSSFKTAPMCDRSATQGSDFIKLLDDNGQEAGKFYIGASGFLKDDAYEITIQLKKKESVQIKEKPDSTKTFNQNVVTDSIQTEPNIPVDLLVPPSEPIENQILNKIENDGTDIDAHPKTKSTSTGAKDSNAHSSDLEGNLINTEAKEKYINELNTRSTEKIENMPKQFVEKGSQLSYVEPSECLKNEIAPKPATSTYTQTTINSPNTRPVYFHMSSSTSTAYMSPPETILPMYLRQNYTACSYDETRPHVEKCLKVHHESDQISTCTCQQCLLYEKKTVNKVDINPKSNKKTKIDLGKTSTPPNTARNYLNTSLETDNHCNRSPRIRNKCRKCNSRIKATSNAKCSRRIKSTYKLSPNIYMMRPMTNTLKSFQTNFNEKDRKSNLNPVIKNYVKKLLELNRNGLKAIEIANQECSSVSTPGSSIIEVSRNINNKATDINNKISLEQIKGLLKEKILEEYVKNTDLRDKFHVCQSKKSKYCLPKISKRSVHKVKSLNISKKILKPKKSNSSLHHSTKTRITKPSCSTSSPSSTGVVNIKEPPVSKTTGHSNRRIRSRSSPTPRHTNKHDSTNDNTCSDSLFIPKQMKNNNEKNTGFVKYPKNYTKKTSDYILPLHKATITTPDFDNDVNNSQNRVDCPTNTSTQTSQDVDSEINLIKMAEDKIQNMEKIADLTEKCTKRISNLARILEEVRKNKSLAYSHISTSDTASDTDQKSDKVKNISDPMQRPPTHPIVQVQKETTTFTANGQNGEINEYISFLKDIPKPEEYKFSNDQSTTSIDTEKPTTPVNNQSMNKIRTRPPPALSRITLKHGVQDVIPHELSTVIEVDSPMSLKLKNQSSRGDIPETSNLISSSHVKKDIGDQTTKTEIQVNPDLLQNSNSTLSKPPISNSSLPNESKIQMMDLKQFNEVMLKPFISLQEYAKQCEVGVLDEGSNMDDNVRDDLVNDELSSMHSDGSLPDVIAELLKRNIIAEPFKFDPVSNVNSTTVSSESTLSVLALSKVRNNKKKSSVVFQNKENISETSDTLSFSSNPDLENAFKKLGMGWASSTLKKTKERLALSSSSNTSSSSLSQFKTKHLNNQEIPALVTDSVLSASRINKKKIQGKDSIDKAKNAEQQTSFMTSMTVKEFLTNELAKKITFTNKSHRNESGEEFVSLLETKMPDEMKHSSRNIHEEHSMESIPSGCNNRARTSTPVQIFKSMTYHSSSSSNISNGLFSNADDLSSVKGTSNSMRNHSTSDKGDLTIPNCSLKVRKGASDCSKSD